jgi:hypothetical protein
MGLQVHEVVLPEQDYQSAAPNDVVAAVQRFAWEINRRSIPDSALPPEVIQSKYVEYYCQQVQNGNIGQFVINSRQTPHVIAGIRAGLAAIRSEEQAALFEQVVRFVESSSMELDAIRGTFFEGLATHYDGYEVACQTLHAAHARWIRSWPHIRLVSRDRYGAELDRLAQFARAGGEGKLPPFRSPPRPRPQPARSLNVRKTLDNQRGSWVRQQQRAGLRGPNSTAWPLIYAGVSGLAVAPAIAGAFSLQLPDFIPAASSYASSVTLFVLLSSGVNFVFNLATALTAALSGAPIREFSIGFGPELLSYARRSLRFRLGVLPLGGYVRWLDAKTAAAKGEKTIETLSPLLRLTAAAAGPVSLLILAWILTGLSPAAQASTVLGGLADIVQMRPGGAVQFWSSLSNMLKSKPWLDSLGYFSMVTGVLNLLPLPLLNGGQIVIVLIETAMGRRASNRVYEIGGRLTLLMMLAVLALLFWGLSRFLVAG